jgi:hypothetical protein
LVYAYAVGQRSSRQIERLCQTDEAFRVVCAQDGPDHVAIARFRAEQERAFDGLFPKVLMVYARAGWVDQIWAGSRLGKMTSNWLKRAHLGDVDNAIEAGGACGTAPGRGRPGR